MGYSSKRADKARKAYNFVLNLDSAGIAVVDERLLAEAIAEHYSVPARVIDPDYYPFEIDRDRKFRREMDRD